MKKLLWTGRGTVYKTLILCWLVGGAIIGIVDAGTNTPTGYHQLDQKVQKIGQQPKHHHVKAAQKTYTCKYHGIPVSCDVYK